MTCVIMPEYSLCFDLGPGLESSVPMEHFFVTHAHLDHAAGIPYIISLKTLNKTKSPIFYLNETMLEPMHEIMNQWMKMEGHQYDFEFRSVGLGEDIPLNNETFVRVFPTVHRVRSQGYTLFRKNKKLKPEYRHLKPAEIIELKQKNIDFEDHLEEPLVSFTGDTKIDFLAKSEAHKARVLFMEVTYLDEKKPISVAREWGHLHLDELVEKIESIEAQKIAIMHISLRYSPQEARRIILNRIPKQHHQRIFVVPPFGAP